MKNLLKFLKALGVIACTALMLAFTTVIFSDIDTTGRVAFIVLDILFAFLLILLLRSLKKKQLEKIPEKAPPAGQPATAFIVSEPQPPAARTTSAQTAVIANPPPQRTRREKKLIARFLKYHGRTMTKLTNEFTNLYRTAATYFDPDTKIRLLEEAICAFQKAFDFCKSKGRGGVLYFETIWEHMSNSQNPDFSYLEWIENALKEAHRLKKAIPKILDMAHGGIAQTDLYQPLETEFSFTKNEVRRIVDDLTKQGLLVKEKKGRSYWLQAAADPPVQTVPQPEHNSRPVQQPISIVPPAAGLPCSPEAALQRIPPELLELLWFENGPLQNISPEANEPSAIDPALPTAKPQGPVPAPDYYPSYRELTPEQRWVYLCWLEDITAPIDIGYVFIFYYGLERCLFTEKWLQAFLTVSALRTQHQNNSFQWYSACGLIIAAAVNQQERILDAPGLMEKYPSLFIRRYGILTIEMLMASPKRWGFANTRYLTGQNARPELFRAALMDELQAVYQQPALPVTAEEMSACEKKETLALANYSLPRRTAFLEDPASSKPVAEKAAAVLAAAHERVKRQLAEERKGS